MSGAENAGLAARVKARYAALLGLVVAAAGLGGRMAVDWWKSGSPLASLGFSEDPAGQMGAYWIHLLWQSLLVVVVAVLFCNSRAAFAWQKWISRQTQDKSKGACTTLRASKATISRWATTKQTPLQSHIFCGVFGFSTHLPPGVTDWVTSFAKFSQLLHGIYGFLHCKVRKNVCHMVVSFSSFWKSGVFHLQYPQLLAVGRRLSSTVHSGVQHSLKRQPSLLGCFEDLSKEELRCVTQLSAGDDFLSALSGYNKTHTWRMRAAIPDVFLVHLGAFFREESSLRALNELGRLEELGNSGALFGKQDSEGCWYDGWSKPVIKSKPGLTFEISKRRWRNGFYLYKTTTVLENTTPSELRSFNMNMKGRKEWDWSMVEWDRIYDPLDKDQDCDTCFYYHNSAMPGPMANREYVCARRVWDRPDGGCYNIVKISNHPNAPERKGRNVRVEEYTCGTIIRRTNSYQGNTSAAVEISSFYFDNPKMKAVAFNLAMKGAMWAAIQAMEKAFRQQQNNVTVHPRSCQDSSFCCEEQRQKCSNIRNAHGQRRGKRRRIVKGLIFGGIAFLVHKKIAN